MQRWLPLVICVIATVVLAAACRSNSSAPAERAASPDVWATVNGRDITKEQVEKEFRRLRNPAENLSAEDTQLAKLSILEDLIVEQVVMARAAALKIDVPESELDAAYGEAKKNITEADFQKELSARNLTAADMRDGLRREMLGRKVMEREVTSKVTVDNQEIEDFFTAHRAQFNLPEESIRLAQIVITPVRDPQIGNRSGDDATTPQAAQAKVSMLMERLKSGVPFGDLARDYSEDAPTAQRGGDLGLIPISRIKQAPPLLQDAALNTTIGSARVVSDGTGAHTIVFVVAREPAGQRDLSTPGVRDQITAAIREGREQLLRAAYLAAARTDADVTNYLAKTVVESQGKPVK